MKLQDYKDWTQITIIIPNGDWSVEKNHWEPGFLTESEVLLKYQFQPYEILELSYFSHGHLATLGWSGLPK